MCLKVACAVKLCPKITKNPVVLCANTKAFTVRLFHSWRYGPQKIIGHHIHLRSLRMSHFYSGKVTENFVWCWIRPHAILILYDLTQKRNLNFSFTVKTQRASLLSNSFARVSLDGAVTKKWSTVPCDRENRFFPSCASFFSSLPQWRFLLKCPLLYPVWFHCGL